MSWLEGEAAVQPGPQQMQEEWPERYGELTCHTCGDAIRPGEWFRLAGYCAMGGVIPLQDAPAYGDLLEAVGEHLRCAQASS